MDIGAVLGAVDVVEVIAEEDSVVLAHLDVEELVTAQMELLSTLHQLAVPLAGDQRDVPGATLDEAASAALPRQSGRTDRVTQIPANEETLALRVVEPQSDIPLGVELVQPVAAALQ